MDLRSRQSIISLASGIGGLDLAVRLALKDTRTVCYVEREAFAIATLVARMQEQVLDDAPVWTDVRTFNGTAWRGLVDGIIGGYPCQPFSVAGKQRGKEDERNLTEHVIRIVEESQPRWCFFENVGAHLRIGFREVKSELERLSYRVEAGLFSAEQVGAPHKRERLFILAHSNGERLEGWWRYSKIGKQPKNQKRRIPRWIAHLYGVLPSPKFYEWVMGFPIHWTSQKIGTKNYTLWETQSFLYLGRLLSEYWQSGQDYKSNIVYVTPLFM